MSTETITFDLNNKGNSFKPLKTPRLWLFENRVERTMDPLSVMQGGISTKTAPALEHITEIFMYIIGSLQRFIL